MPTVPQRVSTYVREHSLLCAGDRVAVAVSGGADSVGLLRLLLDLRTELGIVISVAHFHHGIRGADADADQSFVSDLASLRDLEVHLEKANTREYAGDRKISLEAAGRELRHRFLAGLLAERKADRIATAHTLDDQAETVLMKLLRGAGTRGLSGIFPEQRVAGGAIVRPLLAIRREEVREYLREVDQAWREDESNADLSFTRNRVRARVLPALRGEVNPSSDLALAHLAEIARAEEEYWSERTEDLLPLMLTTAPARLALLSSPITTAEEPPGLRSVPNISFDIQALQHQPLAMRRRLLRAAGERLGCNLDFDHVEAILHLLSQRSVGGKQRKTVELERGWRARLLFSELRLERFEGTMERAAYTHCLPVPGEAEIKELGTTIRACISQVNGSFENASYNRAHSIELPTFAGLVVRNWRTGDRFQAAGHTSEKRLKQLLYPLHLSPEDKAGWPVVAAGERIIWVRGIPSPEVRTAAGEKLWIGEFTR